uniref:Sema domain-containing protein n=1 Tax=Panagrellus redivivus TaxID=6233 RepID=A0A7E4VW35_PANRE
MSEPVAICLAVFIYQIASVVAVNWPFENPPNISTILGTEAYSFVGLSDCEISVQQHPDLSTCPFLMNSTLPKIDRGYPCGTVFSTLYFHDLQHGSIKTRIPKLLVVYRQLFDYEKESKDGWIYRLVDLPRPGDDPDMIRDLDRKRLDLSKAGTLLKMGVKFAHLDIMGILFDQASGLLYVITNEALPFCHVFLMELNGDNTLENTLIYSFSLNSKFVGAVGFASDPYLENFYIFKRTHWIDSNRIETFEIPMRSAFTALKSGTTNLRRFRVDADSDPYKAFTRKHFSVSSGLLFTELVDGTANNRTITPISTEFDDRSPHLVSCGSEALTPRINSVLFVLKGVDACTVAENDWPDCVQLAEITISQKPALSYESLLAITMIAVMMFLIISIILIIMGYRQWRKSSNHHLYHTSPRKPTYFFPAATSISDFESV